MKDRWNVGLVIDSLLDKANEVAARAEVKSLSNMDMMQIRIWYNGFVSSIDDLIKKWQQEGVDVMERASRCCEIRHSGRVQARDLMLKIEGGKEMRQELEARDLETYGNKDGPTFEFAISKAKKMIVDELKATGATCDEKTLMQQAAQAIIEGSQKTNKFVNEIVNSNSPDIQNSTSSNETPNSMKSNL